MTKKTLGGVIKEGRDALRLTQRGLAEIVGVKASHIAYIESGLRRPSLSLVRRLAETLGLNKQKLLLMTYPEARYLIAQAVTPPPGNPDAAWKQFAGDQAMLAQHSVTAAELKILRQVSLLGRVATPRNLLFVLNAIRQAVSED